MALVTREPTGRTAWPKILVEGGDKSGKSWSVAELSASPKVGRTVVMALGEDESRWDEYGKLPGARFKIAVHDGTWRAITATVEDARAEAAAAVEAGEPPFVFCIDTMTAVWEGLKDWASLRARGSKKNKKLLEEDPDAEIDVTSNYWNDANARHRALMRALLSFPGIVILIARGSEVALFQNGQPVAGRTSWSIEGQKNLPYDVSAHIRLHRDMRPQLVSASGVHHNHRPGVDKPRMLPSDWTLESFIFGTLKLDPAGAGVGEYKTMRHDAELTPEQVRDEAVKPGTGKVRMQELWKECKQVGFDSITVANERGQEELLMPMIVRLGKSRPDTQAAPPPVAVPVPTADPAAGLAPDDPWLDAAIAAVTSEDVARIKDELKTSFAGKESTGRYMAILAVLDARDTEIAAQAERQATA